MNTLTDMQGKTLKVGDSVAFVAYTSPGTLTVGTVKRLMKTRAEVAYQGLWGDAIEPVNTRGLIKVSGLTAKPKGATIYTLKPRSV
jgi:hypothetical protein